MSRLSIIPKRFRILTSIALLCLTSIASAQEAINLRRTVTVDVVKRTKDAVVNVSTTKVVNQRVGPFGNDPFWQQFDFGEVRRVPANSLGSGFLVHRDGYVVTNNHVIDRVRKIDVELADGRKLPAELISADAEADLAILKISSDKPFPVLDLGDSGDLMIGEPVIAVGNPMGFSHSVSTGIVSAAHRELKDPQGHVMLSDLIQTDAAINPGNSGGPLLNAYGQVIGINTAIRGDAQNIGFAIQVNKLRDLIPELMNPGQVTKVDVPITLREHRTLTGPATVGVRIEWTSEGTTHRVTSIDGEKLKDIIDAYAILLRAKANSEVTLMTDNGKGAKVKTKAVPMPDAIVQARKRLGLGIEQLTPMLAQKYGLTTDDGLFVSEVTRAGIGAKAGLQAGDVIVQFGRYRVATLDDFAAMLQHLPEHGKIRVGVIRADRVGFGVLEL